MSRQKPRFTPDPPPYGASNEQILAWVNAQLQRIEDYWPRDDGDRITALEELQSKYSGEWSISGQSLVRFEGSTGAEAFPWNCDEFTSSSLGSTSFTLTQRVPGMYYSSTRDKIYVVLSYSGVFEIDPALNTVTKKVDVSQLIVGGTIWTSSGTEYFTTCYSNSANSKVEHRTYRTSDWSLITNHSFYNIAGSLPFLSPTATSSDIIFCHDPVTRFYAIEKFTTTGIVTFAPANVGGQTDRIIIGSHVSNSAGNEFIAMIYSPNADQIDMYEYTIGTSPALSLSSSTLLASFDLTSSAFTDGSVDSGSSSIQPVYGGYAPLVKDGLVYWPLAELSRGSGVIITNASDGTLVDVVWLYQAGSVSFFNVDGDERPTSSRFYYDEASSHFYFVPRNGYLCRWDGDSTTECCTIDAPDTWDAITPIGTLVLNGDNAYLVDRSVSISGGSAVSGFARIQVYNN